MARVKITLTCTRCGKSFEHIHMCRNSSDAASYEEWAKENVTICPACHAAAKESEKSAKLESYIAGFSEKHPLPMISGVSEKQTAYASSLRKRFISEKLASREFNINRFLALAEKLHPENCSESAITTLKAAAEKEGKPFDKWFAGYRLEYLKRNCQLASADDAAKIEMIFSESNASKIIDALR